MTTPNRPQMLTVREVAAHMGVSRMTVYRLISDEVLRARRIRNVLRISARDLDDFLREANTISWERP